MSAAQRLGLLVKPTRTGSFPVEVTYRDWVTNQKIGYARTMVTVV